MNYRSSRRARSHAEFTARTGIVADESDESLAWLEFSQREAPGYSGIDAPLAGGIGAPEHLFGFRGYSAPPATLGVPPV